MAAEDRRSTRSAREDALALFAVMWALAAVWHLLGNTTQAPAWAQALLAVGAGAVLLRPGAPVALGLLAVGGIVTVWWEAPLVGNHWVLAGLVDLAILLAVLVGALRGRVHDRVDMANRLFAPARLALLVFYAFAAFSKLNSAFLDRTVSCGVHFFRESTDSIGLSGLQLGGAAWLETAVVFGTVAIELMIPLLLLRESTRHKGVWLGLVFHTVLAIDHSHQFFDFSAVLFALFLLFIPGAGSWVAERVGSVRARLALRHERLPQRVHLLLVAVPTCLGLLVSIDVFTRAGALVTGWWPWQVYAVSAVVAVTRFLRQEGHSRPAIGLRPHHLVFVAVPLLVVLNGLTPYLELKTGYGWNMYSNLRTVDGETNHLILPRTFPLTSEQADVVEIVDTDSAALARYAALDYGLTWRQLRTFLAQHPDVRLIYRRAGTLVAVGRAGDRPELVEPVPGWREKVQLFRAVDLQEPERCVPAFGAAR